MPTLSSPSFKTCRGIGAAVVGVRFVVLLVYPALAFGSFEIRGDGSAPFLAHRAAIFLLGLAVALGAARDAPDSPAR